MQPAIHIAVTAYKRPALTKQTVETLLAHNDMSEFFCWYGLDGRGNSENEKILDEAGFTQLVKLKKNRGVCHLTDALLAQVAVHGHEDDYVLLLQNDWECCRPIPVAAIRALMEWQNVGTFRLYGEYKERDGKGNVWHRCATRHLGVAGRPTADWVPHTVCNEDIVIGWIHWGHPPAVTKVPLAVALTARATSEHDSVKRSGRHGFLTARVVKNVFWHIGHRPRYRER